MSPEDFEEKIKSIPYAANFRVELYKQDHTLNVKTFYNGAEFKIATCNGKPKCFITDWKNFMSYKLETQQGKIR
jgi:hypothetical protein